MENGALIGALAIFTIGAALLLGFGALAYFLRDREGREHAHRTLVRGETAATDRSVEAQDGGLAPLGERLNHSKASSHPHDPGRPNRRNEEAVAS